MTSLFARDFNGDGLTDIYELYQPGGDGTSYTGRRFLINNGSGSWNIYQHESSEASNYQSKSYYANHYTADYNGDRKDDLIWSNGGIIKIDTSCLDQSDANTIDHTVVPDYGQSPVCTTISRYVSNIVSGDYDGDQVMDVIYEVTYEGLCGSIDGQAQRTFFYSPMRNISAEITPAIDLEHATVLDMDADGRDELVLPSMNSTSIYNLEIDGSLVLRYQTSDITDEHMVYVGDFNGDGHADMYAYKIGSPNKIYYATGSGFVTWAFEPEETIQFGEIIDATTGNVSQESLIATDINGDGLTDLVHIDLHDIGNEESGYDIYCYESDHFSGFKSPDLVSYVQVKNDHIINVRAGDFNADQASDIYIRDYFYQGILTHKVMAASINGLNRKEALTYTSLVKGNGTTYTTTTPDAFPVNTTSIPITVVSHIDRDNGRDGTNRTSYSYEDMLLHRQGMGLLGFKKVRVHDERNYFYTETTAALNSTYYSLYPEKTETMYRLPGETGHAIMSSEEPSFTYVNKAVNGKKRYWMRADGSVSKDYLQGRKKRTSITYHNNTEGNVYEQTVKYQPLSNDNTVEEHKTRYETYVNACAWIKSKPRSIKTIVNRTEDTGDFTKWDYLTYNTNGAVTSREEFKSTAKELTTTYSSFDNFGRALTTAVSASGLTPRTASVTYDGTQRFVATSTNALNQVSYTYYDPVHGKAISQTGIDGLTTSMGYDGFGREITSHDVRGNVTTTSREWEIGTGSGSSYTSADNSRYKITITAPTGGKTIAYYDVLGRERLMETLLFDGTYSKVGQVYKPEGTLLGKTLPYTSSGSPKKTTYLYDEFNRIERETTTGLNAINYDYTIVGDLFEQETNHIVNGTTQFQRISTDAAGKKVELEDNASSVAYTYANSGGEKRVTVGGVETMSMTYDSWGRQETLTDVNAGTTTYTYNAYGELGYQKDAKNQETTSTYDQLGRVETTTIVPEGTISYTYVPSGNGINQVQTISGIGGATETYDYDSYQNVYKRTETIAGETFEHTYTYDSYNRLQTETYPTGLKIDYAYNSRGYLSTVKKGSTVIYTGQQMNAYGQMTQYKLGNNITSYESYDEYGLPDRFTSGAVFDQEYVWDHNGGNLSSRQDHRKGQTESFQYDQLNRLKNASGVGSTKTFSYYDNGNIKTKWDISGSNLEYTDHKLTTVPNATTVIPSATQTITYTSAQQPNLITEGTATLQFTYGATFAQRSKTSYIENNILKEERYYLGAYERRKVYGAGAKTQDIHYITGHGLNAIIVREDGGADQIYYCYSDYLGSILSVTNSTGSIVTEQNFDAWGRRRNQNNWTYTNGGAQPDWLYRGYTGHEHLQSIFNTINMNGRLYDPLVGRMLSVDNYVQEGAGSQGYNRYSYALNNPLKYTDPDGENPFVFAAIGVGVNGVINVARGRDFFDGWMQAALGGAMSGGYLNAVGSAINGHLPTYNLDLGGGLSLSIGPSLSFGSTGFSLGVRFGLNYTDEYFSAGVSFGVGYIHRELGRNTVSGFTTTVGVGASLRFGDEDSFGLYTSHFNGAGISQQVAGFRLGIGKFSVGYENDDAPFGDLFGGLGDALKDEGDRWRTAAAYIAWGDVDLRMNLFTGDPTGEPDRENPEYPLGVHTGDADMYRLGALSLGYRGYRAGWNSEVIRDFFQNRIAHNLVKPQPYFRRLASGYPGSFYSEVNRWSNPYSLWSF